MVIVIKKIRRGEPIWDNYCAINDVMRLLESGHVERFQNSAFRPKFAQLDD
jgi:hypothetical protein